MKKLAALLLLGVCGSALAADATLTWTAVTTDTDGNATTVTAYKVYKGPQGGAKVVVNTSTNLTFVDQNLPVGTTCYVVTASNAVGEGGPSGEGCKSVAAGKPGAPTLTVK